MDRTVNTVVSFQSGSSNHYDLGVETNPGVLQGQSADAAYPAASYAHYLGYLAAYGVLLVVGAIIFHRIKAVARARRNEADPGFPVSSSEKINQRDNYSKLPTLATWGAPDAKWRKDKG